MSAPLAPTATSGQRTALSLDEVVTTTTTKVKENEMRLALLGGSGRIGGHILNWAMTAGHEVTVLARDPQSVPAGPGVTVIAGQATDAAAVAEVAVGADAVVSALGPRGAKTPALLGTAGGAIVAAMDKAGVRRLVCVSAAGAFIDGDPDTGPVIKFILPKVLAKQFADVRAMESTVTASDLDWTLVRATRLVNAQQTGRYRVRPDYPPVAGRTIARSDVAHFAAAVLTDGTWVRARPALAY
jgi:putative NADH-flavin reductase